MRPSLDKQDPLSLHEAKAEKLNPYAKWAAKECITRKPKQCKSKMQRGGEIFDTCGCFCIFLLSLSTWRMIIVGLWWRGLKNECKASHGLCLLALHEEKQNLQTGLDWTDIQYKEYKLKTIQSQRGYKIPPRYDHQKLTWKRFHAISITRNLTVQ